MLRVRLGYGGRQTPEFIALLDSGADRSLFHADLALYLGIDLTAGRMIQGSGIGGAVSTSICPVQLEVEGYPFAADVMFSAQIPTTIALLGRDNVFEKFRFGFDHRGNRLLFDRYS